MSMYYLYYECLLQQYTTRPEGSVLYKIRYKSTAATHRERRARTCVTDHNIGKDYIICIYVTYIVMQLVNNIYAYVI